MNKNYRYLYFINDIKFAQCFYSLRSQDSFLVSSVQGKLELFYLQGNKTSSVSKVQMTKDKQVWIQCMVQLDPNFDNKSSGNAKKQKFEAN